MSELVLDCLGAEEHEGGVRPVIKKIGEMATNAMYGASGLAEVIKQEFIRWRGEPGNEDEDERTPRNAWLD